MHNPISETVTLDTPIQRGDTTVSTITVHKPSAGALRGTNLQALGTLDVDALVKVLPRITTPPLTQQELYELDPADLMQLGSAFIGFLAPKAALAKAQEAYLIP